MDRDLWQTVGLVTTWQIAASICYYAVFAAGPFFRDAFGLSRFGVGLTVTALTLGYAVCLIPVGALTDRYGERVTLTGGLVGLAAGMVLVASASGYTSLLIAVALLGAVYSTAMPGTNKAVYDTIPASRLNTAMGIKQVGITGGSGLSALLVTGLAGYFVWQAGFLVAAVIGIVVAVAFYTLYRTTQERTAEYPDLRALTSNRSYVLLALSGLFLGAALFTTTGYTILYVEESIGGSIAFGGVVLAIVQLFGSGGRVLSGWLADRLPGDPHKRIGGILLVQTLASGVLFLVVARTSTPRSAGFAFAVLGFFVLGFTGVYYSYMTTLVSPGAVGSATAGCQLTLNAGALVAPPVFGLLVDTADYRAGWSFLAVTCLLAALLVAAVIRSRPPRARTA